MLPERRAPPTTPLPESDTAETKPEPSAKLDSVDTARNNDIALLRSLGVQYICDLMVEDRKVKYGLQLTSSEKVLITTDTQLPQSVVPQCASRPRWTSTPATRKDSILSLCRTRDVNCSRNFETSSTVDPAFDTIGTQWRSTQLCNCH